MRDITFEAIQAFNNNKNFKKSNTQVKADTTGTYLYLWGNLIARKVGNRIQVTLAGYNTVTTRERLRGLCNCYTKKGIPYINGKQVTSTEWVQL